MEASDNYNYMVLVSWLNSIMPTNRACGDPSYSVVDKLDEYIAITEWWTKGLDTRSGLITHLVKSYIIANFAAKIRYSLEYGYGHSEWLKARSESMLLFLQRNHNSRTFRHGVVTSYVLA